MTNLTKLTIADARDAMRRGDFTSKELTEEHLKVVEKIRPLNAFVTETLDVALRQADGADESFKKGKTASMCGIPVAIKDLFCTKGTKTTAGSRMLENFIPTYESTVTKKLFADGAVMLGKANMDEFAMGSSNETSYFGPVINPWRAEGSNQNLVPGGSSGGSATAVAAFAAMGATGTDTGGSIRQPGSLTATVGMKPSYGRCSRWGVVAFASSLDHPGVFSRTVKDGAIMLESMAGYDPMDSTSVNVPVPNYEESLRGGIRGMKIGVPKEYRIDGMPAEIETLWQQGISWLKASGAKIVDISLPNTRHALPAYYIVAPAECSSNLARYDGVRYGHRSMPEGGSLDDMYKASRSEGFGDEVKRRILIGTYVLSAGYYDSYYLKAQKTRMRIVEDFQKAYQKVDVILTPTSPNAAFPIGDINEDPLAMYLNDVFTVPANMAGLPAISVPAGLSKEGLPLGLQIIGPSFREDLVFKVAGVLEEAANFTAQPQNWWGN
ncbi:MAG: Asp-tRNA(Asn)/Glu-tRNA(Gln) amidotransferase subunit GatA [Sphingomonadales bacterium]